MRRLFTVEEATARGLTRAALRWGERSGRWRRIDREVYAEGPCDPDAVDAARARVLAVRGVASGRLAAMLHGLDGVTEPDARPLRRRALAEERTVFIGGVRCADGLQTLIDLAADVEDREWEQALESALRLRLTSISEIEIALPSLGRARTPGVRRMRRVLAVRGHGPPTESLLETLMVQLVREVDCLSEPTRQHEIVDSHGTFLARVVPGARRATPRSPARLRRPPRDRGRRGDGMVARSIHLARGGASSEDDGTPSRCPRRAGASAPPLAP